MFKGVFIKQIHKKEKRPVHWCHEDGSIRMFRYLLSENNIDLSQYNLSAQDQTFIEEMIEGKEEEKRVGRPKGKFYLYDIVNNTRSGLDLDKIDYFLRFSNCIYAARSCMCLHMQIT